MQVEEKFPVQMDKAGRVVIPPHIRRRLGIYGKAAEVELALRVKEVYEE